MPRWCCCSCYCYNVSDRRDLQGNPRNKVALRPGHSLMDWVRLGQSGKDLTGVKGILQDVTVAQLAKHNKRHDAWLAIRGNPRNKVALRPGHSLMDWVRLGQSGKDLTGVKGILQDVTVAQLAKHNKRHDAWLAIRGRVYNVSHYMDFHPGGEEELMRGVGKDATDLFNQVHAWVNFESLLQKCLVGRLRKNESSKVDLGVLLFGSKKSNTRAKQVPVLPGPTVTEDSKPKGRVPVPMDWFQKQDSVSVMYYTKETCPAVEVRLVDDRDLSVYVRLGDTDTLLSHLSLEEEVSWPCTVSTNNDTGKIELQLVKKLPKLWVRLGAECSDNGMLHSNTDVFAPFSEYSVAGVTPVTHNTKLLVLRRRDCAYRTVPIGHHVRVRSNIQGMAISRSYTPVVPALCPSFMPPEWQPDALCLMVKEYPTGALTPWLCSLCPGDTVELSGPEGSFSTKLLAEMTRLYLVAAGTGLTPMLTLIAWALGVKGCRSLKISLIFFNRDEKDRLWAEQLEKLDQENERFTVTHVLSEASEDWVGRRGHIDKFLLQELLPDISSDPTQFVCLCGPTAFTELARKLLVDLGCPEQRYHCFLG
uniref:Cytochrome b5 reductase 4 n=1 Tax=Timema monikensis TaxID=170555 RepID=A0A7R9HTH0_9NEOP|nr:unnamed protein product [Timema monikensis]